MNNYNGQPPQLIAIDQGAFQAFLEHLQAKQDEILEKVKSLNERLDALQETVKRYDDYRHLPEWIDKKTALSILPFRDGRKLDDLVKDELIRAKPLHRKGRGWRYAYSKSDCLDFVIRVAKLHIEESFNHQ